MLFTLLRIEPITEQRHCLSQYFYPTWIISFCWCVFALWWVTNWLNSLTEWNINMNVSALNTSHLIKHCWIMWKLHLFAPLFICLQHFISWRSTLSPHLSSEEAGRAAERPMEMNVSWEWPDEGKQTRRLKAASVAELWTSSVAADLLCSLFLFRLKLIVWVWARFVSGSSRRKHCSFSSSALR